MRCLLLLLVVLGSPLLARTNAPAPDHAVTCVGGIAEGFPCNSVNLAAHLSNAQLGGGSGNDIWGWTDPDTQKEYALMGSSIGTAFVDISDPALPISLGRLPTHTGSSSWRDIKTRGYYAFIVSEAADHGMQVFDLRHLRGVSDPATIYAEDAHFGGFGSAHNVVINTESGYAFAVGAQQIPLQCNTTGLYMVDIRNPLVPVYGGCFSADGYTHDAQCVNYQDPDLDYIGHEICLASNEDTVTIVDVSNKFTPVQISRTGYLGSGYTHQGWLTEDARYFLVDDETDEINDGHNTRTYVFNVSNLDAPVLHTTYTAAVAASDHNLYVRGRYAYEANYRSGLRILDLIDIDAGAINEVGFFDTHPESDAAGTSGAWSVYPFFASGTVILSDISAGLFILQPVLCPGIDPPTGLVASAAGDQQIALSWDLGQPGDHYEVHRAIDGCGGLETLIASDLTQPNLLDSSVSGGVAYGYRIRQRSADGQCRSDFSTCQMAQTSGACTAPPNFAGLASASSPGSTQCTVNLAWPAASARCGGPVRFTVERSAGSSFDPLQSSVLADGLVATSYVDLSASSGTAYAYRVQALDLGNGSVDGNLVSLSTQAVGPLADGNFQSGAELGEVLLDSTGGNRHLGWEIVSDVAHSGQRGYFSGYGDSSCLALYSPTLTISAGQSAVLSFFTRYGIEPGRDAGLLQISNDGGSNWQILNPVGGYPSQMNNANSSDACGFVNNQPAFTGTALSWQAYSFDLSAHLGAIKLRWLFSTDGAQTDAGWWIDDVVVSHVQVPGSCDDIEHLFAAGFESP